LRGEFKMKRASWLVVMVVSLLGGFNHTVSQVYAQYYDCSVTCSAIGPETGEVGKPIQFGVTAIPYYCNGQPTYAWTFGNGVTSTLVNPSITYQATGSFTWNVSVLVDGQSASAGGVIIITPRSVASVSAASYEGSALASESIAAAFGANLATSTQVAGTLPLPTEIGGTRVRVKDSAGVDRWAPLFFVSPAQINYQVPPGTATGTATVTVMIGNDAIGEGTVQISATAPGIFTANSSGIGVPAAQVLRVKPGGAQIYESAIDFDAGQGKFVPRPIDLGPADDIVFLVLFGTGIRYANGLSAVIVSIGGTSGGVQYAGPQGVYVGEDQVNVVLPRSLAGRGELDLTTTVNGKTANTVRVKIK
jgi:uncharacterized protein (TIGR03437 family)